MVSKLDLINDVLGELGIPTVTAESDSPAAQYVGRKLDRLHRTLLRATNWIWALKYRYDNTPLIQNFSPDYNYAYALPADYGRFYRWATSGAQWPIYTIADGRILSQTKPIQFYYVVNNASYEVISPQYEQTLIFFTAYMCSAQLTENLQLTAFLKQEFRTSRVEAIMFNNMELPTYTAPYNDYNRITYV